MSDLIVAFDSMRTSQVLSLGRGVSNAMRDNEHFKPYWSSCPTSLDQLDESIEEVQNAEIASKSGDHGELERRKASQKLLCSRLRNISHFVQMVAFGDVNKLRGSGFPLRKARGGKAVPKIAAAPILTVKHSEVSRTLLAKASGVPSGRGVEVQVCTGDPRDESNWAGLAMFGTSSNMVITDREPGTLYSFRARVIAAGGPGAWSLPVTIMAL